MFSAAYCRSLLSHANDAAPARSTERARSEMPVLPYPDRSKPTAESRSNK